MADPKLLLPVNMQGLASESFKKGHEININKLLEYLNDLEARFAPIEAEFAAGQFVNAVSFVPQLTATTTNPTLGTGATQTGHYRRFGDWVDGFALFIFGTGATAGSGEYRVSLPIASNAPQHTPLGGVWIFDNSATSFLVAACSTITSNSGRIIVEAGSAVTNALPWTWAVTDHILYRFAYPVI